MWLGRASWFRKEHSANTFPSGGGAGKGFLSKDGGLLSSLWG